MDDKSIQKIVYLALNNVSKKWSMPISRWVAVLSQLEILYGNFDYDLVQARIYTYTKSPTDSFLVHLYYIPVCQKPLQRASFRLPFYIHTTSLD